MKRRAIVALSALALAGCGGSTTTTKAASACVLTESGAKLCGQDALNWCHSYTNVGTECNIARADGWIAKDRKKIAECKSEGRECPDSAEKDIRDAEEAIRGGQFGTLLVIHTAQGNVDE